MARGALAEIDPATRSKVGDVPLKAHPEVFQIDPDTNRIFVNVPDALVLAVVDAPAHKQIGEWSTRDRGANFPMALDRARRSRSRDLSGFPRKLRVFSAVGRQARYLDARDLRRRR